MKADIDGWQGMITSLLLEAGASPIYVSTFRVLGTWQTRGLNGWSGEHVHERETLSERIARLEKVLERLHETYPV